MNDIDRASYAAKCNAQAARIAALTARCEALEAGLQALEEEARDNDGDCSWCSGTDWRHFKACPFTALSQGQGAGEERE